MTSQLALVDYNARRAGFSALLEFMIRRHVAGQGATLRTQLLRSTAICTGNIEGWSMR